MYCAIFIVYLLYQMCELFKIVLHILLCVYRIYLWHEKSGSVQMYAGRETNVRMIVNIRDKI